MKTIEDMLQQLGSTVSLWWKEEPKKAMPAKKSYNEIELWGREGFNAVYSLQMQANELERLNAQKYAIDSSSLHLQAANKAMEYTKDIADLEARKFLIGKALTLYALSCSPYYRIITRSEYQAWHPLTLDIFRAYLSLESKCAALSLLVDNGDMYGTTIRMINNANYVLKTKYPAVQTAEIFIEAAVNAQKTLFPDVLVLQLYNFALENLQAEFYGNNPSAEVKRLYKSLIYASMAIATKSNNEAVQGHFVRLQQEQQVMQDKLDIANIVRIELEANPGKTSVDLGWRGLNDEDVENIVAVLNLNPQITSLILNRAARQNWVGAEVLTFNSSELENVFGVRGFISLARLRYVQRLDFAAKTHEDQVINAVINDDLASLKHILAELAKLNNVEDLIKVLNNSLLVATAFGKAKMVSYLLTSGADLKSLDDDLARAAMFSAIYAGHDQVVLSVLEYILANEQYFSLFQESILTIATYMGLELFDNVRQFLMPRTLDLELRNNLDRLDCYLRAVPSESKESKEADDFARINRWVVLSDSQHRVEILVLLNTIMQQLKGVTQVTEDKGYDKFCEWQELINGLVARVASNKEPEPVIFSDYTKLVNNKEVLALDEAAVGLGYYQLGVDLTKLRLMSQVAPEADIEETPAPILNDALKPKSESISSDGSITIDADTNTPASQQFEKASSYRPPSPNSL